MAKAKDLTGQKFGRLTVISRSEKKDKNHNVYWNCKCDCGNLCVVLSNLLKNGHTKSCGCLKKDRVIERNFKHGMTHTKIYKIWAAIIKRCLNSNDKAYKNYGGRGITVYPAWIDDFQAFYDYVSALEHFGEEGYSLDRIDNNGNYEPSNLRWADRKIQNRNTRRNVMVEYNGEKMCLKDAAEKVGIRYDVLVQRYCRGDRDERLFRPLTER